LGIRDLEEFIGQSTLSESVRKEQNEIKGITGENTIKEEYYLGYYLGEEDKVISSKFILSEQSGKATMHLIYWEDKNTSSEYLYEGSILYQQNGMSIFFNNHGTILDRSAFIAIQCERRVKVKPILVGFVSGYDRDRRPVTGEIVLQKVDSPKDLADMAQRKEINPAIAQYLGGRRWAIDIKMIQTVQELSPSSKYAHIIEKFIGDFSGVFATADDDIYRL